MEKETKNRVDISGMEPENKNSGNKLSFFKRVWISIKDFDKYQIFAIEGFRKSLLYIIQLMIIFVIVISVAFTYQFSEMLQKGITYFREEVPNLSFSDNTLQIEQEEPIIINELTEFPGIIILDTVSSDEEIDKTIENLKTYENGILILKDKIMLKNTMTNMIGTYMYSDLIEQYGIEETFNKQDIIDGITSINFMTIYSTFFGVTFFYLFILYLSSTLVDAIILAALGYLTALISKLRFRFKPIFNMAIHALTLPILLNAVYIAVNTLTGFEIQYFQIMYTTISYIYMITAILMIKSDIIKQQIELEALKAEQQKVKEEIEAEKERKRLEKEEQERRKRREEKRKQKEKEKEEKELKPSENET